jgi:hypothetical protein
VKRQASHKSWLLAICPLIAILSAACSSDTPTATPVLPSPTATFVLSTPLPDDVLIENVRQFLATSPLNVFLTPVDAEGDGRLATNCLDVLEGGPDGFEWSVELREDGQTVVRLRHSASLVEPDTGTWLAIPEGGVGTAPDSLNCDLVPNRAYTRDNP